MSNRIKYFNIVPLTVLLIFASLPTPTANAATSNTVHLEVEFADTIEPTPSGFWASIRQFLGVRRVALIRPEPGTKLTVHSSAYAPSPYQTDSTPCVTAAGTRVRDGTVASNFLPLGTLLEINEDTYIVEDRMNPRYTRSIDIFFASTSDALEFGRQKIDVTIKGYGEPGQAIRAEPDQENEGQTIIVSTDEPSFADRLLGNWYVLRRVTRTLLGAGISPDVNRYDVNCFE